jgi:hypothetical protein
MTDRARESAPRISNALSPCRPCRQRESMGAERTGGRPADARADSLLHAHGNLPPSACGSRATRAPTIDSNYIRRCGHWAPDRGEENHSRKPRWRQRFCGRGGWRPLTRGALAASLHPAHSEGQECLVKSHARSARSSRVVDERLSANGARCAPGTSDGSAVGGGPAQRRSQAHLGREWLRRAVRFLPRHTRSRRGGIRGRGRARRAFHAPSLPPPLPRHLAGEPHALRGCCPAPGRRLGPPRIGG